MKVLFVIISLFMGTLLAANGMEPEGDSTDITARPGFAWKFQTNGPIVGSPLIDNDKVIVGGLDSTLYALDINTGSVIWKYKAQGPFRGSPCLHENRIYLVSGNGLLYRIASDSGRFEGTFNALNGVMGDRQYDFADYFGSTPIVSDKMIYFGSGDDIYAVSLENGFVRWTYRTGGPVHSSPVISGNRLYSGSFDGHIYALDLHTGSLVWKFKSTGNAYFPKGEVMGNPVTVYGMVIAGARDYNLYAVDGRGGFCNWMKTFPAGWALPITVNDTVVYAGTSDDRTLFAFHAVNGSEIWKTDAGFNIMGGMAIGKYFGYFGTLAGKLHAIDLRTGKIAWTVQTDSYSNNSQKWLKPDDKYRDDIGKLIKTPPGILNLYRDLGGIFGKPALSGNRIIFAGYDGWIYCFKGSDK